MAIITLPPAVRIRHVEWTLDQPAQVNRSEWTKRRQVVDQPGPALWSASADLVVAIGEDAALEAEAFLVDLEGPRNSFRLGLTEGPQFAFAMGVQVDGAGQSGNALDLKGGIPGAVLRRGYKITVGDQPVMVMAPATFGDDGKTTASFKPSLRASPANNVAVEVTTPTVLVSLAGSQVGWSVDPGQIYQMKQLALEEAF